jgi:hypothetical protein
MSQNLREKASAILEVASTQQAARPPPCPACGMVMSLPESSAHLVAPPAR